MPLKDSLLSGPGPKTPREAAVLAAKGFCMGSADVIPGVSGGTIAFITGIYENLIEAIRSFDLDCVKKLLRLDVVGVLDDVHLRFLLPLLCGVGLAILTMARLMNHLMTAHPIPVWSCFFGLIAGSILIVGRNIEKADAKTVPALALGVLAGYAIVGLIPVATPETLPFIFFCGALAICAMILPGISGAFILLILGKYVFITGALKNPFSIENMAVILVFVCGCVLGLAFFSRLLHFFLARFHRETIALLTGFMVGSMRKIWPWKDVLETQQIGKKVFVLREENILPALNGDLATPLALMALGFVAVLLLDRLTPGKKMPPAA